MTEAADPWRKSLTPRKLTYTERKQRMAMLVQNLKTSLDELEQILPPDEPEPEDTEPDSPEFTKYMRHINRLRRELHSLRRK
ncbi:MAG: hypothetical protein ABR985_14395 [Methanotrichaceae archaeon]|jgi:hypothetical protein